MGLVGSIKKFAKKHWYLDPVGLGPWRAGEHIRKRFERQTSLGKKWKSMYQSMGGKGSAYGNANFNVSGSSASQLANTGFRSYR